MGKLDGKEVFWKKKKKKKLLLNWRTRMVNGLLNFLNTTELIN